MKLGGPICQEICAPSQSSGYLYCSSLTGGGMTIGDNKTDQVVIINGSDGDHTDIDGEEVYGGADLTLAHELIHALRGGYGIKSGGTEGISDEEAYTIQAENAIRAELGYGLRGDGSASDDVDGDGRGDGDGSYGEYIDGTGVREWYLNLDEYAGNGTSSLSGTLFSGAGGTDSTCKTDCSYVFVHDAYCWYDASCGSHEETDAACGEIIPDSYCKMDSTCNPHAKDGYCALDSTCNPHTVYDSGCGPIVYDSYCKKDSTCNPHAKDGYCALDSKCNPHTVYDSGCGPIVYDS